MKKIGSIRRMRRGRLMLIIGSVLFAAAGILLYLTLNPIQFRSGASRAELGEPYNPADQIRSVFGASPSDVTVEGEIDTSQTGVQTITFSVGGRRQTLDVSVMDTTAPQLEVHNVETDIDSEVDAESFVTSCFDQSRVSVQIVNPNALINRKGNRMVTIEAKDEYGNITRRSAQLIRS